MHRETNVRRSERGEAGWLRRNLVPLVIALALLMETTDATILSTALPSIAASIHAPVLSLKLALTSYLIALAAFVPASGWVADRIGAKRVFVAAIAVFLTGSLLCALQTNLEGLILSRALQGMGGAMMVPVGRLIVLRSASKQELLVAMSYVTVPALIGPAIGPVLGALLTSGFGWRAIFLVNLPLGLAGIALALRFLPNVRVSRPGSFDTIGFTLSAAGLSLLMFGLSALGGHVIANRAAIGCALAGCALTALYFHRAAGRHDALLDPTLLKTRTFGVGLIGGLFFRTSGGSAAFLLPLLFQIGFGLSVVHSGLLSAIYALGALTMRTLAPRLIDLFGFRGVLMTGAAASSICLIAFGLQQTLYLPVLVPLLIVAGFAQALTFTAANGIVYADMDDSRMGRATSFSAVVQQVSLSFGIAVAAFVLQLGSGGTGAARLSLDHFAAAFHTVAVLTLLSLFAFARLRPRDGDVVRHPEHALHHHLA